MKTLLNYAAKHPDRFASVSHEGPNGLDGYEIVLKDGWRKCDDYVHSLVYHRASEALGAMRAVVPCDCSDCSRRFVTK